MCSIFIISRYFYCSSFALFPGKPMFICSHKISCNISCNILLHLLPSLFIFIMFQRPWKSPARISFLNFIAFSAKNSLRFLMMLLIHRNFKCPCTCTSCMHTGQMLRYFWIFDKSLLYRIYFHSISILSFYTYNVKIYSESF